MEQINPTEQPIKQKPKHTKWQVLAICLITIIAVQSILLLVIFSQAQASERNLRDLTSQYSTFQSTYGNLQNDYANLQQQRSQLQSSYNSLQSSYNNLQTEYDNYADSYQAIKEQINIHSTPTAEDAEQFVTPTALEVVNVMIQATGGWSNHNDWDELWADMKKLYDWLTSNIEYASDPAYPVLPSQPSWGLSWSEEYWQSPTETLRTKHGDCEDQALLLTSLIRAYTSQSYAAYCIEITGHVAMFCPVANDEICILDPAGHYTTNLGFPSYNLASEDIRQEVNSWLNYMGGNGQVFMVFSDDSCHTFSGTEDFITWMYNR